MTNAELIKKLKQFPKEAEIVWGNDGRDLIDVVGCDMQVQYIPFRGKTKESEEKPFILMFFEE